MLINYTHSQYTCRALYTFFCLDFSTVRAASPQSLPIFSSLFEEAVHTHWYPYAAPPSRRVTYTALCSSVFFRSKGYMRRTWQATRVAFLYNETWCSRALLIRPAEMMYIVSFYLSAFVIYCIFDDFVPAMARRGVRTVLSVETRCYW